MNWIAVIGTIFAAGGAVWAILRLLRDDGIDRANEKSAEERAVMIQRQMEAGRAAREKVFDARAGSVTTADDAARLLRDALDDPETN